MLLFTFRMRDNSLAKQIEHLFARQGMPGCMSPDVNRTQPFPSQAAMRGIDSQRHTAGQPTRQLKFCLMLIALFLCLL